MPPAAKAQKFKARVEKFPGQGAWRFIPVPAKVFKALGGKVNTRVLCRAGDKAPFPCALLSSGKERPPACVILSGARLKALRADVGTLLQIELTLDKSRYGMPLPVELKECLKQDRLARERFDALSPGKRRNIIYFVSTLKSAPKRVDRASSALQKLKALPAGVKGAEFSSVFKSTPLPEPARKEPDAEFLSKFLPASALRRGK